MRPTRVVCAVALAGAALIVLAACAAGPNTAAHLGTGQPAGFWLGLWHGLISPITFIVSLFDDHVSIYEVHNSGNWYDFGFMLGVSSAFSGTARTSCTGRRRARSAREQTPSRRSPSS